MEKSSGFSFSFLALGAFFVLVFSSLAFAQCPYIDVSLLDNSQVQPGVDAVFPITVTNAGLNSQLVSLAALCNGPLYCSFSPAPYATLPPTQSASFSLYAHSAVNGVFQISVSLSAGTQQDCDSRTLTLNVSTGQATPTPLPSQSFEFSFTPSDNQSARPGEEIQYWLSAKNNLNQKVFVQFTSAGAFKETTFYSLGDIDLASGEMKNVSIRVRIPPATPASVYQKVFNARVSTADGVQYYYNFPAQIFVYSERLNLALLNEPLNCTPVLHNEEVVIPLRVRNTGEIEGPFDIELNAGDNAYSMLSVWPGRLEVRQGDTQEVDVSIRPPSSAVLDAYPYQFVLSYYGVPVFVKNYCFNVYAKLNFTADLQPNYQVRRGEVQVLLPFNITNTGSVRQNFAVEVRPPANLLVQPDPQAFAIDAGEARQAFIAVSPSRIMPTGLVRVLGVIRTGSIAKAIFFNITVLPSTDEQVQDLQLMQESVRAYAGVETRLLVTVRNNKDFALHNVRLSFDGIPSGWYSTQSLTIQSRSSQGVYAVFSIPSGQGTAALSLNSTLTSDEGVAGGRQMVLYVEQPQSKISASIVDIQVVPTQGGRDLFVRIIASNTGQKPLYDVKAFSPTGFAIATQPGQVFLQPGQSTEILVTINNPPGESLPLALQASDGTTTEFLTVTAQPQPYQFPSWAWILLAVLGIIAIIYVVFVRQQEQYV